MKVKEFLAAATTVQSSRDGKTWTPERPKTYENSFWIPRINNAWKVLRGRADAVEWEDTQ